MFWKKKPVKLTFFTSDKNTFNYFRPRSGGDMLPSWWKKIGKNNLPTMKGCVGLTNAYSSSIIIPMWTDTELKVKTDGQYFYQFFDAKSAITTHPPYQRGDFAPHEKFTHLKIRAPWVIKCDEDVKFVVTQNVWSFNNVDDFIPLTGVVDFKHQHSVNVNLFVSNPPEIDKDITIEANTPFVFLYPQTEREVVLEFKLITEKEMEEIATDGFSFSKNSYHRKKKMIEELKQNQNKCPFGGK